MLFSENGGRRTFLLLFQALFARGAELAAEGDWHREAILAKAKPLLAAGCSSCQEPLFTSLFLFLCSLIVYDLHVLGRDERNVILPGPVHTAF